MEKKSMHGKKIPRMEMLDEGLQWVSNAKISAQNSNFEKTDHLLGKVTEIFFQTLIKEWPDDLGMI